MIKLSRLANKSLDIPKGVTVNVLAHQVEIKGSKQVNSVFVSLPKYLQVLNENNQLSLSVAPITESKKSKRIKLIRDLKALSGTIYTSLKNNLKGANEEFKLELVLVGVGYRAQAQQGNKLNLTLGFSHPVVYTIPAGVRVEIPAQTEIILFSSNKELLGKTAAEIREYRPREPYKGKGIRYKGEKVILKETKKK